MSAIAGCCWLDGRVAAPDDFIPPSPLPAPLQTRVAGSLALACATGATVSDPTPLYSAGAITIAIVGSLDNIDDIAERLAIPRQSAPEVVQAAWRRWGSGLGTHLIGDYLVLVSDERERRVAAIRSPLGQHSFFYGVTPQAVVFGSDIHQVVRHPAIPAEVDEGMAAEYLAAAPNTVRDTLWRGVHRLPPGHALEIADGILRETCHWDFDPQTSLPYRRPQEFADHLRDLVTSSVRCCLGDGRRAGVYLSGGIDSSAIAGVAQTIAAASGRETVHAFTLAFPGRACDETAYSQAVVEKWALRVTRLNARPLTRGEFERMTLDSLDVPPPPNGTVSDPLRAAAAAAGMDVMLTGFGGDDFFTGDAFPRIRHLRQGRVIAWARSLVSPLVSARTRDVLRPVFGARRPRRPWIAPAFAARTALDDRLQPRAAPAFPTREQAQIYRDATGLVQVLGDETECRAARLAGLRQRHPFNDRRVAEFGLALPASERWRGDEIKIALRRALGEFLPAVVAARTTLADKAEFSSTYVDSLEALGGRDLFRRPRCEAAGWIDGRTVRRMYDQMIELYSRGDGAYIAHAGPLWAIAALELWLGQCARGIPLEKAP